MAQQQMSADGYRVQNPATGEVVETVEHATDEEHALLRERAHPEHEADGGAREREVVGEHDRELRIARAQQLEVLDAALRLEHREPTRAAVRERGVEEFPELQVRATAFAARHADPVFAHAGRAARELERREHGGALQQGPTRDAHVIRSNRTRTRRPPAAARS